MPEGIFSGEQTVSVYDQEQIELTDENGTVVNKEPCDSESERTLPGKKLTAKLKEDAIPLIQETVEVITRDQAPDPDAARPQNIIEVDGGWNRRLELEVSPPSTDAGRYLDEGDQIEITLPGFDLSGAAFDSQAARDLIEIRGSGDEEDVSGAVSLTQVDVDVLGGKLTIDPSRFSLRFTGRGRTSRYHHPRKEPVS